MSRTYLSTRERILRAAATLFAGNGYGASSTRDIAATAQVDPVTIFRQFRTKPELFLATVDWLADQAQFGQKFSDLYCTCNRDTAASLQAVVAACLDVCDKVPTFFGVLKQVMLENQTNAEMVGLFDSIERGYIEPIHSYVTTLVRSLPSLDDPELSALMFYGALIALIDAQLKISGKSTTEMQRSRDGLAYAIVNLLIKGSKSLL